MPEKTKTLILGAGLTGLATARFLGKKHKYLLCEKNKKIGGLAASYKKDGFTFDMTGHLLHFRDPTFEKFALKLLPEKIVKVERNAAIFTQGRTIPYPFQANLGALSSDVAKECLMGFFEAWRKNRKPKKGDSFHTWVKNTFGDGIARHFMLPYNEKLWSTDLKTMSADWVSWSVPRPSADEVLDGALGLQKKQFGYNTHFFYPKRGGIETFTKALAGGVGPIHLNCEASRISPKKREVTFKNGETLSYQNLVSTLPITSLVAITENAPSAVRNAASRLRQANVCCVNVGFRKPKVSGHHWVYFPEKKYPFYRIGFPSNFAPSLAPRGHSTAYVEIAYAPGKRPRPAAMVRRVIAGLKDWGVIRGERDIAVCDTLFIEPAYVIFDSAREKALNTIFTFYKKYGIQSSGRYGQWDYLSMENSLQIGRALSRQLVNR